MLRLMGAALVMGSGLWLGLAPRQAMTGRIRALEAWAEALALLAGEMAFRLPDVPALLRTLARRCSAPARETLLAAERGLEALDERPFDEIWHAAVAGSQGPLTGEDLELLCRLGAVLGSCGWLEQAPAVAELRRELRERADTLRRRRDKEGRAYATAGLALGAVVSIMLL